jgi:general secretion pathway protein K
MAQPVKLQQYQGSALIVALLIMTLVAIAATMMILQQQTQIQRTSLVLNNDRMYLYGKAVENWAITVLNADLAEAQSQTDAQSSDLNNTAIDILPKTFNEITVDNAYKISGRIEDLQSRFNLNTIADKKSQAAFSRLIMAVDPDIEKDKADAITSAVNDWVNKPKQVQTGTNTPSNNNTSQATPANSAINKFYTQKQHPPYRAAQANMASVSELRLVKGVTPELYLRLLPFVTALPGTTAINVNTASGPVFASLGDGIDLQDAISLVQNRGDQPFDSLDDFYNDDTIAHANIPKQSVTMNSSYFLVTAEISTGSEKMVLHALIYRPLPTDTDTQNNTDTDDNQDKDTSDNATTDNTAKAKTVILWESRGGI